MPRASASGSYGTVTVEGGAPSQINSSGNYYNGLQIDTASNANSNPPYEMVDQFRVIRNLFSARYGMVQGAVDYGMREGTNKLHGDGFLIDRNQFFDSDGFFPVYNGQGKPIPPANIQSEWGGTVGGPVVLPKLYNGHNKTFFLFSARSLQLEAGSDGLTARFQRRQRLAATSPSSSIPMAYRSRFTIRPPACSSWDAAALSPT